MFHRTARIGQDPALDMAVTIIQFGMHMRQLRPNSAEFISKARRWGCPERKSHARCDNAKQIEQREDSPCPDPSDLS